MSNQGPWAWPARWVWCSRLLDISLLSKKCHTMIPSNILHSKSTLIFCWKCDNVTKLQNELNILNIILFRMVYFQNLFIQNDQILSSWKPLVVNILHIFFLPRCNFFQICRVFKTRACHSTTSIYPARRIIFVETWNMIERLMEK